MSEPASKVIAIREALEANPPRPKARPAPVGVSAAALQGKTFAPIRWVVPGLIPDGLTLLAGKPKLGKSWLMLSAAIAVAEGSYALGDRKCAEGDVLYAALEDNERRLQSRLSKVLGDAEWSSRLTFWTEMAPLDAGGLEQLEGWALSVPHPRLIIIDTFAKVKSPALKNEGVYDADHRATAPLKALADRLGVGIILVHHLRKAGADDDPFDAISGSTGLTGVVDTPMVLTRGSEGVTLYGRGRDVREVELAVEFDRSTCRWRELGNAAEVRVSDERRAILQALRDEDEPMTPKAIADVTGFVGGNVRRLLIKMAKADEIRRGKRGSYTLPDLPPDNNGNSGNNGDVA